MPSYKNPVGLCEHDNYEIVIIEDYFDLEYETISAEELLKDEKKMFSFIEGVKRIVRSSFEYKEYVDFLKNFKDMRYCSFFNNIKNYDYSNNKYKRNIKIEIHHEPFSMHDIVGTIVRKFIFEDFMLDPLLIAEEVMRVHYMNMIGLIPVCLTAHQLVHNNKIFVPMNSVKGRYEKFYNEYKRYMASEVIEKYKYKEAKTKDYNHKDNTKILETKFIYYKYNGSDLCMIDGNESDFERFLDKMKPKKIIVRI